MNALQLTVDDDGGGRIEWSDRFRTDLDRGEEEIAGISRVLQTNRFSCEAVLIESWPMPPWEAVLCCVSPSLT